MAAAHKKGIGVSFLFGGEKKEGGTCAVLIRESHMAERRAGEGGKKTRTGRGMDGAKEVQHSVCFSQKTSCIVKACLQLFGGTSPSCCHLHQAPFLYFNVLGFFFDGFLSFTQFWDKKEGICLYHSKDHEGTETVTSLMTIMKYVD